MLWEYNHNDQELYHYGRKGMKWGQNIFGKVKSAYGTVRAKQKEKRAVKKAEKAADKLRKKPINKLTDAELEKRINRLTKEKQVLDLQRNISSLNNERVAMGKKFTSAAVTKVIAPALVDAGKDVLTRWLKKQGYDLAGLGEAKDAFSELKKKADVIKRQREMSDDQRKIRENDLWSKKQDEKEAKERVEKEVEETIRKNEEAAKKRKQQAKEAEEREAHKVYEGKVSGTGTSFKTKKTKKKSSKPAGYYDPIDSYFVDRDTPVSSVRNTDAYQIGSRYVERLLLPPPD